MDAVTFFLHEHARTHSARVGGSDWGCLEDELLKGLDEAQLRQRPNEDLNPIAWSLWHIARCEDVGINAVLAGVKQELDGGNWLPRLGVPRRDIGTEMSPAEVDELAGQIDLDALLAYRTAVGLRTRGFVPELGPEDLEGEIDPMRVRRAIEGGALGEGAGWVGDHWEGKPKAWFLWLGSGHNYWHIGEAWCAREAHLRHTS